VVALPGGRVAPAWPQPADHAYAYVGTYTPNGGGIYLFRIDRATAALTQLQVVDGIRNPASIPRLVNSRASERCSRGAVPRPM
jgi:6-phosphogluconolactonase